MHTQWVLYKSTANPAELWMRDSRLDEDSGVRLGLAKCPLSGSLIQSLVEVFPLLKFISHAYPLSFVQVNLQSRSTMDAWFPLRWRFRCRTGLAKCHLSGSLILSLVKVIPLLKFISHAYPLSFVQVNLQSRSTMDPWFPLRWRFRCWTGLAKCHLSGSLIPSLVKVIPLLKFISHAYPLSFVQVNLQSHKTNVDPWFPLRWRFRGRTWTGKISFVRVTNPIIGEGVPPVKIHLTRISSEFCTSQPPIPQHYGSVIPTKMKIPGSDLDWQNVICQGH